MPAGKPANWGKRPTKKAREVASPAALDKFVNPGKEQKLSRLNLGIPATLHARMKSQCALEGRSMTDVLLEMLEARFLQK